MKKVCSRCGILRIPADSGLLRDSPWTQFEGEEKVYYCARCLEHLETIAKFDPVAILTVGKVWKHKPDFVEIAEKAEKGG